MSSSFNMTEDTVKVTIYLVRHGECAGNVEQKALDPFTDILTDVGRQQAKLLGENLKHVNFTQAFTSDYPRTHVTAEIILKESGNSETVQLQSEARIRERGYEGLIGRPASEAISLLIDDMKAGTPYLKVDIDNCEPILKFEDRIINFISELIQNLRETGKKEETVLLVSHGLTCQRLMVLLNSRPEAFGIQNWTKNLFSERLMRNTTYHKILLEIPRDPNGVVTGKVEHAHFREHLTGGEGSSKDHGDGKNKSMKDQRNYTFIEDKEREMTPFEEETVHYCKPV